MISELQRREENIRYANRWADFKGRRAVIIEEFLGIKKRQMIIVSILSLIIKNIIILKAR